MTCSRCSLRPGRMRVGGSAILNGGEIISTQRGVEKGKKKKKTFLE